VPGDTKTRIVWRKTAFHIAALAVLLPVAKSVAADRHLLRLLWDRDLRSFIREAPGASAHSHFIAHLEVSADEQWVLIDVAADSGGPYHQLLMPVDLEAHPAEQYAYTPIARPFLSPHADLLVFQEFGAIRVEDRRNQSHCSVEVTTAHLNGILRSEFFLLTQTGLDRRTRYEVYDRKCQLQDAWELPGGLLATVLSPESGRVLVMQSPSPRPGLRTVTLLIEWPSWKMVEQFPYGIGGDVVADDGRVVCVAVAPDNMPVRCQEVGGGQLPQRVRIHGGYPLSVASAGTLAAGNDWFSLWKPFTEAGYWVYVRRQVLWDIRSGDIVAEWHPALQKQVHYPGAGVGSPGRFPYLCALSRTGRFLFEAGDEKLSMSRTR